MSTFIIILLVAGILSLAIFHKPKEATNAELIKWFSSQLSDIADNLESDIEKDKKGEFPHAGKQSFEKQGLIVYIINNKNNARFEISDKDDISLSDIIQTSGYRKFETITRNLDISILLEEKLVEGDGAETFQEIDEYIDDIPRYYTISISGW